MTTQLQRELAVSRPHLTCIDSGVRFQSLRGHKHNLPSAQAKQVFVRLQRVDTP
jgi:hypothetical protein